MITKETRRESYIDILGKCGERYKQCIEGLTKIQPCTANELAMYLYKQGKTPFFNRNFVHPRLNELVNMNLVEVVGKKEDKITGKTCAMYSMKNETKDGQMSMWNVS